jgi:transcriptional regulator with XRE-family HTH domain
MTTNAHERAIPQLTLGWRLKMALSHGRVSRDAMAEHLGVSPSTISRWCNDGGGEPPKRAYIVQWALLTSVDPDWLESGKGHIDGPDPDDGRPDPDGAIQALVERKRPKAPYVAARVGAGVGDLAA